MNRDFLTKLIKKTFALAKKGEGFVSPNPLVGAVIVKDKKVIATGYHKRAGLPHAEIEAMRKVKMPLEEAELYVNLEPCSHWGKTPPCVEEIIRAKFKKVVIATPDPNPQVRGKSIKKLIQAGIKVVVGILPEEAERLNEVFFKNMRKRLPFVVVKVAQSLDGKIALKSGDSKWITKEETRVFAKMLRDKYDAVLVGINTVIKDDPSLNGVKKEPHKVVIDPSLRIPLDCNLFHKSSKKIIIFASPTHNKKKLSYLKDKAEVVIVTKAKETGMFDLKEILKILYQKGIMSVFVEGGANTLGRFFDQAVVDKIYFFFAPRIIGGEESLTSVGGEGVRKINEAVEIKDWKFRRIKDDFLIIGYPKFKVKRKGKKQVKR
ncbi:MAG: riboflavin biosynthesis protein RibD [Candidatus Omnitrophica bacterium 4484_70.1]|nr:MAG: riboflavin biosynthesis protein RibD [Candidatus Omnitrophica bacterium 4484_70.1]